MEFTSTLRKRKSPTSTTTWIFVTTPELVTQEIRSSQQGLPRQGFGSIKVEVRIGFVKRSTSIFPHKESGGYLLPIKKQIRKELKIDEGDEVLITLVLL